MACASASKPRTKALPSADSACIPKTDHERIAEALMAVLVNDAPQSAQFGLDSLRLVRDQAIPILVCHLTDETPLETPEHLEWLFLQPNFELIGHYSPDTVGEAVWMVLGRPPGMREECTDQSAAGRTQCQAAWVRQLGDGAAER
jgi:hypothetical protein